MHLKLRSLLLGTVFSTACSVAAFAQAMSLKATGYIYSGFDAFGNTYHIPGPPPYYTPGSLPYGMPFVMEFKYTLSSLGADYDPSAGLLHTNRPTQVYAWEPSSSPSFLSANLTINGTTVAIDTRWYSRIIYQPAYNSLLFAGNADRWAMDPNGGQGAEAVSLSLNLHGQAFDPAVPATFLPPGGFASNGEAWVRIFQDNSQQFMSFYPPGRFTEGAYHWVEMYGIVTRVELSAVTGGTTGGGGTVTPVPEPSTYGLMGAAVCGAFGWLRRRRRAA